jgi:DNA recombination protein RmuC
MNVPELKLLLLALVAVLAIVSLVLHFRLRTVGIEAAAAARRASEDVEARHREMLRDLHAGLNGVADRVSGAGAATTETLRRSLDARLQTASEAMNALQISNQKELAASRESVLAHLADQRDQLLRTLAALRVELLERSLSILAEQTKAQTQSMQDSLRALSQQLSGNVESLTRTVDGRLEQIQGRVGEKLEEGFRKTNETFTSVMARLATIDEAQRKIDGLTTNVVSLQELLGDKRSRGAFGEVQLENLVRNLLPPTAYEFQHTLSNGHRADCVLRMPEPTGLVAVDAKFPLENYHRMFDLSLGEADRRDAQRAFRADVRKHVDDIANRYVVAGETSDGAVMFVPAEAVFAEIHGYHGEVVDHAMSRHVWIVSPTTMMAVLNTARAVLKDVETRRQVHVIKDELAKLGKDFGRFDERMRKLAAHIRQAHEDAENVQISSDKIVRRFRRIEEVELDPEHHPAASLAAEPMDDVAPAPLAAPADGR